MHSFILIFRQFYPGNDIAFFSCYTTNKRPNFTSLVTHERDNIILLVENKLVSDSNVKGHLLLAVPAIVFVYIFFRKIIRVLTNSPHSDVISIFMDTWGTLLSTYSANIYSRPERIMTLTILLLSILVSNFVTALIFDYLLAKPIQTGIDSIKELHEHGIEILVNEEMRPTMSEWMDDL